MGCYKRNSRGGGEEREGLDNDRIYERQPALDLHRGGRVSNLLSFLITRVIFQHVITLFTLESIHMQREILKTILSVFTEGRL